MLFSTPLNFKPSTLHCAIALSSAQSASSLMSSKNESEKEQKTNEEFNLSNMQIDPVQMGNIMKMMSIMKKQNKDDDNTRLLIALKPHLSDERRKKVDKAISLLKIVKFLPILKENGFESLFGG